MDKKATSSLYSYPWCTTGVDHTIYLLSPALLWFKDQLIIIGSKFFSHEFEPGFIRFNDHITIRIFVTHVEGEFNGNESTFAPLNCDPRNFICVIGIEAIKVHAVDLRYTSNFYLFLNRICNVDKVLEYIH